LLQAAVFIAALPGDYKRFQGFCVHSLSDSVLTQKSPFQAAILVSDASKPLSDASDIRPVEPLCGYEMHLSNLNYSKCNVSYIPSNWNLNI